MSTEAPRRPATPPAPVRQLAAARPVCLAWENDHALTFEVGDGPDRYFVKWAPAGSPLDLAAEAARMTWAAAFTPVPRVLGHGADGEGSWLVTAALPGHSAVSPRWLADPRTAERAAAAGRLDTSDWAPEHLELAPHLDRIADFSAAVADLDERASRQAADGAQSAGPSLLRCRGGGRRAWEARAVVRAAWAAPGPPPGCLPRFCLSRRPWAGIGPARSQSHGW